MGFGLSRSNVGFQQAPPPPPPPMTAPSFGGGISRPGTLSSAPMQIGTGVDRAPVVGHGAYQMNGIPRLDSTSRSPYAGSSASMGQRMMQSPIMDGYRPPPGVDQHTGVAMRAPQGPNPVDAARAAMAASKGGSGLQGSVAPPPGPDLNDPKNAALAGYR